MHHCTALRQVQNLTGGDVQPCMVFSILYAGRYGWMIGVDKPIILTGAFRYITPHRLFPLRHGPTRRRGYRPYRFHGQWEALLWLVFLLTLHSSEGLRLS